MAEKTAVPAPAGKKLVGTGAGLVTFELYVMRIDMATRASTRPGGSGNEGYPTRVVIGEKVKEVKVPIEYADEQNKLAAWTLIGMPNDHMWLFPKDAVKPGMSLNVNAVWVNATPRSASPNYRYDLQIEIPNH